MAEIQDKYLALYPDGHHEEIVLGELLNKGGASGRIYLDNSHPKSVAKIYHDRKNSEINRKKLEAMLHNRPNIPVIKHKDKTGDKVVEKEYIQIAWPTALLEDKQGFCVGYLMPLIDTNDAISMDHLMQKAVRQKLGISERYVNRIYAAYNIASVVAALHACGHYIVDLKPSNVSVYKGTMLVALFDCDGFSIKGENNERYPAEYVSEEYIYPEGMEQTCQEMGEEQDKFALAVIIFKLLNEGIHPFSGVPRKSVNMLSIQERIADYHYAYGMWQDTYQAPHPYSIHDYFDKNTMVLFERAFTKGNERPSALEWQSLLEYLVKNRKQCKKDHNHAYFTPKGCGLCMVKEKFKAQMEEYKKQQQEPQTVRGMKVEKITAENMVRQNQEQAYLDNLKHYGFYVFCAVYLLFFAFLYKLAVPYKTEIIQAGIFAQLIFITVGIYALNWLLKILPRIFPLAKNQNILNMLQIFAVFCLLIAYITVNGLPFDLFRLAE